MYIYSGFLAFQNGTGFENYVQKLGWRRVRFGKSKRNAQWKSYPRSIVLYGGSLIL